MKNSHRFLAWATATSTALLVASGCAPVADCDAGPAEGTASCAPAAGGAFELPSSFVVIDVAPSTRVNALSAGREVMVRLESEGMTLEPTGVLGKGGWSRSGEVFVSYSPQPGDDEVPILRWIVPTFACVRLNVSATPIGGAIDIYVDGEQRHVDLYRGEGSTPAPGMEGGIILSGCR